MYLRLQYAAAPTATHMLASPVLLHSRCFLDALQRPTCTSGPWHACSLPPALPNNKQVTCLLDFWRIGVGGIVEGAPGGSGTDGGLPWL